MNRIVTIIASLALLALGCAKEKGNLGSPVPNADPPKVPFVRVAEIAIVPAQLDAYTAAVKEEMETSIRIEPGVLAIYAVAERDSPTKLRFFEMYADEAAYHAHIASAHFQKYVTITKDMISSRRLIDTVPVQLSAKKN